ncbi:hypothetical protein ACHAC9_22245 [Massilia sp. CMS3.1]|uniref:hypothetical protein n=1 Tax=Massilia sp. CMS3.1 TaxID=3373083 RepID=UPI003EE63361
MTNNALLQNTSPQTHRPHDTTKKSLDRRHIRSGPRTPEESLRTLCHYQGLLIEVLQEKAANGNA